MSNEQMSEFPALVFDYFSNDKMTATQKGSKGSPQFVQILYANIFNDENYGFDIHPEEGGEGCLQHGHPPDGPHLRFRQGMSRSCAHATLFFFYFPFQLLITVNCLK